MPENRNRLRPKQIKFFVNDKEYELIRKKMEQMGTDNMSAYIRKMVIDGYVVKLELPELRELTSKMKRISNSENQIAKRLNETDNIYEADIEEIKKNQEEIYEGIRKIQLRRSVADFEKIVEGFGMFPNKFLQRAAPLKFAKSTSVSTRALLAKFVLNLASKSKIFIFRKISSTVFCEKSQSVHTPTVLAILYFSKWQVPFPKWKSAATAALSAHKQNGRTLSMAAKPFILTIDGVRRFCYLAKFE